MKDTAVVISLVVFGLLFVAVVAFAGTGFNLAQLKFWGPQYADAEREIFEGSASYNHAMIRNLRGIHRDYQMADEGSTERQVLRGAFLHEVDAYDRDELPSDLQQFLKELESQP